MRLFFENFEKMTIAFPLLSKVKKKVNEPLWRIASYVCDIINVRDLGDIERTTPVKKRLFPNCQPFQVNRFDYKLEPLMICRSG